MRSKQKDSAVKKIFTIVLLLCAVGVCARQTPADEKPSKNESKPLWHNELRVGWGDQLFESLMWHNPTYVVTTMPESFTKVYHENYRHNQHLWMEYQYFTAKWFSAGVMVDVSEVDWNDVTRNGKGLELERSPLKYFYNVVAMPTMRFTYLNHPRACVYSGLGFGLGINGGTEENAKHQKTEIGMAINLTLIGASVNFGRWFIAVDLGGLTSFRDKNTIYLAFSRMMNASAGVRF